MISYAVATDGEKLALFLHERVLPPFPEKLAQTLAHTGRHEALGIFFREIAVVNLACRIVEAGNSIMGTLSCNLSDPMFQREFLAFLREKLLLVPPLIDQLARFGQRAVAASHEQVTSKEHAKYKGQFQRSNHDCYMCGQRIDYSELDCVAGFTLDHIWPRRYGGNSIEDNLLPACQSCNSIKKKDFASWAMTSVQSVIFGFSPSAASLSSLKGEHKFALHYLAARDLANRRQYPLKKAFLLIGPWNEVRVKEDDDLGDFFNLVNCELDGSA